MDEHDGFVDLPRYDDAEYEEALRASRDARPRPADIAPFLLEGSEYLPSDATDEELLEIGEHLNRQEGRMHVMRADFFGRLWGKPRTSAQDSERIVGEVRFILQITTAAAERLLCASLRLSRGFRRTRESIEAGVLPWAHAEILLVAAGAIDPDRLEEFEGRALALIEGCSIGQVRDRIRRLVDTMHPEGMVARHKAAKEHRHLSLEPGADGMAWLHLYIEAADAIAVVDRIDKYAVAAHGEQGEARTLGQLRADAAVDLLLEDTEDATEGELAEGDRRVRRGNTIKPEVCVTVPVLTLLGQSEEPGQLRGYGPIDPETARQLTADAPSLYRLLINPETGVVISLGAEHYEVPAGLKRFLRIRDERCRFPGCKRPSHLCDIDHVHPWVRGGPTDYDNLICLCRRHHQDKDRGWTAELLPDGRVRWTSPFGRVRFTRPAMNIGSETAAAV